MSVSAAEVRHREVLMRVRLGFPVVQLVVAGAVLVAIYVTFSWESVSWPTLLACFDVRLALEAAARESPGPVPWAVVIGGAMVLALSAWLGWELLRLTWGSSTRWPNLVGGLALAATWSALAVLPVAAAYLLVLELPTT